MGSRQQACKEVGIVDQTYYRLRKEYGGLQLERGPVFNCLQCEHGVVGRVRNWNSIA